MPLETLEAFAKHGGLFGLVLGVLLLVLTIAVLHLWRRLVELQNLLMSIQDVRVQEAKDVRQELMEQNEETGRAISELSTSLQLLKEAAFLREKKR